MSFLGALEELGLIKRDSSQQFQKGFSSGIFGFINTKSLPKMGEREDLHAYRGWVYACVIAIRDQGQQKGKTKGRGL